MSDPLVEIIEPFSLATQGRTLEGRIPLAALQRLAPLLRSTEGEVAYTLHFEVDQGGVPRVKGHVEATLMLQCQRCMMDMPFVVSNPVQLGIVRTRQAAEQLPANLEPLLVDAEGVTVGSIVEDELILALPVVAMHELEACPEGEAIRHKPGADQEDASAESEQRENPFAVLAQLKKHD
jgi:uncharacterized protein